ncbi:MAG: PKHD-type hydroxylase YbiX [uncultured Paraburkholderia sp.]|nr:MAG: PKHD-type hydroxylase YbiX [uncultured Paraburkholderia sp.]
MIVSIPDVFTPADAAAMRAHLEAAADAWVDGRATAGYQGASVKRNQQIAEGSPIALEMGDRIIAALERHPLFISAALPNKVYPPLFNRYEGGMHFGSHVDGAIRLMPGSGARVSSFFWVQSLVRDDTQRAMLFDLDGAIQRLNASNADDAARRTLVGCYHNLLRMWSET